MWLLAFIPFEAFLDVIWYAVNCGLLGGFVYLVFYTVKWLEENVPWRK